MSCAISPLGSSHRSVLIGAAVILAVGSIWLGSAARVIAAATLNAGSVSPASGTTQTNFLFSVRYLSDQGFSPSSVTAQVAGTSLTLALVSGQADDGTYQATTTLPQGTWPVTFSAAVSQGPKPVPLAGPTVVVTAPQSTATPSPSPSPSPTASVPPPTPTATPIPTSTATSRPTATPVATPPSTARPPSAPPTAGPTAAPGASPILVPSPVSAGSSLPPSGTATDGPSPVATSGSTEGAEPSASVREDVLSGTPLAGGGSGALPWIVLGGGMSLAGAAVLGWQLRLRRQRLHR